MSIKQSFKEYIHDREPDNSPKGEFCLDFTDDTEFIDYEIDTLQQLINYLRRREASGSVIEAARELWSEYRSYRVRNK